MRLSLFSSIVSIGMALSFSSCNTDKDDDDNDDDRTYPELTATFTVSGAISESYTFTNVENDGISSTHVLVSSFSNSTGLFTIAGSNVNYVFNMSAPVPGVQSGTYSLTNGQYGHLDDQQPQTFDELISGSITITSAQLLWTVVGSSIYAVNGSWVTELSDGESTPSTVTFTGSFTNLVVLPG